MAARKRTTRTGRTSTGRTSTGRTSTGRTSTGRTGIGRTGKAEASRRAPADDARTAELMSRLAEAIPNPRCELDHTDAWTLLMATILSAQSTDKTVNTVTPELFRRWPTPAALAAAPREAVEQVVHRTGFFRNKAKAIQACSQAIVELHGGRVPRDMPALVALPGVARKTANVVLGVAFGVPSGVVVDTHVARLSKLLGLSSSDKPEQIERDLCDALPQPLWVDGGHRILLHGRYLCTARKPDCARCPLNELCDARQQAPAGSWQERARREAALVQGGGAATA